MMLCTKINQKINLIMDIAKVAHAKEVQDVGPAGASTDAAAGGSAEAGAAAGGAQTDADDSSVLMCGFMAKGSSKERTWKRRWFVLRDGVLAYYTSSDASVPKGVIALATCVIEGLSVREGHTLPSMALVVDGREVLLQADSKKDNVAWFLAVNCAQQRLDYARKLEAERRTPDARVMAFFRQPFRATLELDDHPLPVDALAALESIVRFHSALHTLSFCFAGLADAHLEPLCRALSGNKFVRKVSLRGNSIGSAGCELLAGALAKNETIEELYLCDNAVDDAGAARLAEALNTHHMLRVLDLTTNSIGDAGVLALLAALAKTQTRVDALQLSRNAVGDRGAIAIAEFIKGQPAVLKRVHLADNAIGDDGVVVLLETLPATELEELYVSGNKYAAQSNTLRSLVCDVVLKARALQHLDAFPLVLDLPAISALRLTRRE